MKRAILTPQRRHQKIVRGFFIVLLALLPLIAVQAPAHAQAEATPILLGEFARTSMSAGDEVAYTMVISTSGEYTVAYIADGSAEDFLITVIDANSKELYSDVMAPELNIELTAGEYLFLFAALSDAELGFVVGIEGGSMTTDPDAPGVLFNGASFLTENVTEALYATITIEPSPYPQQMGVLVQGTDGDIYDVELFSPESFEYASTSTDESSFVRMVTTGGDYQLTVTPRGRTRFLQVSIFLSGPAPVLALGVATEKELTGSDDTDTYQFTVEEAGTVIEIVVTSDEEVNVSAGFKPGDSKWRSYTYPGDPTILTWIAPKAGVYYVELRTDAETGATYTVTVNERGRAAKLKLNEPTIGRTSAGASTEYIVDVEEPESFMLVILIGADGSDIDLAVSRYKDGEEVASDSSRSIGSREIVALYADEPAQYFVTVDGAWSDNDVEFAIAAYSDTVANFLALVNDFSATADNETQPLSPSADLTPRADGSIEQWASAAEASSEYTGDSWSARQVTGAPDTPEAGDKVTAWAAFSVDEQEETLTLTFNFAVIPTGIEIYESYNPGAVSKIEVLDSNTDEWVVVWEGVADTIGEEIAIFSPPLTAVDFATNQVRITIDEPSVPSWNEIDAVKLIGIPE